MDFNFDTGEIYGGLQTLDVTTLPPLGGQAGVLTIVGSGAVTVPVGTQLERPATPVAGMFRFNDDTDLLEYYDGSQWNPLSTSSSTVSSVAASSNSSSLTISGSPITSAGTFQFTLDAGLEALGTFNSTGVLVATGANTWASRTITGTAGNLVVTDGSGVAGNPTLDLASVSQAASGSFVKVTLDGFGRVTGNTAVTTADITILVDATYVNVSGDTMTGPLVMGTGTYITLTDAPINGTDAVNKDYADSLANGLSWKTSVVAGTVTPDVFTTAYDNGSIIDGYTLSTGERFLIKSYGTGVLTLGTVVPGSGYDTDAVYTNVPLTGGSGSGAEATITVSGGVVTTVVITDPGLGYTEGNSLSAADVDLGGRTGGSAFSVPISSLENSRNGIYTVNASGAPTRADDMDATTPVNEVNGAAVFVENGSTLADTAWVQTATVTTIGTNPITWTQFAGAGSYTAGNGLTLSGTQFSLSSPVSIANGGTALSTTPSNGQLLIGNGTGYTLATLTDGTAISITEGAGTITIANTGVTSIAGTANQITASAATGAVTLSVPATFIAPGSVQVTTSLTVDTLTPNGALYAGAAGLVTSTAALTDGQILIGDTGSVPVAATLTGGTGVTVTNGAGSITIDIDSAEVVTTFSAGTTGFTPSSATSGAITLAGTLATTNGGTGLTTIGTADQFLSVNAGASGLEYKTIAAGTGISVTPGANVLTIANTGVTSVALSLPSIFTVSGSPVTTTGTLTGSLATQSANTVFAGPSSGGAAAPTFRTLVLDDLGTALQLYTENPSTPTAPSATGANAVAIGSGSTATAAGSYAVGAGTDSRIFGQKAYANGVFATAGDAQHGVYVLRSETTDNTLTELFLDGTAGSESIVLPDNSLFVFDIFVAARRTDATGGGAGYRFVGVAKKDGTSGSVTFVGTPSKTIIGETNGVWDAAVSVNTSNGSLRIRVTGENAKTIRWVATVQTTEATN